MSVTKFMATAAILTCLSSGAALAADVTGIWLSASGETKVRIAPCGGSLCGTVVWAKGDPLDAENPDAGKRSRPVAGIQMLSGLKSTGKNEEYAGKLYNYKDGKTYDGKMSLASADKLKLSGCVLGGMICKSQTWSRSK
ncbi:MAG: DUF2147 domain-containing protein [Hyphomicrobiales bacterium]